ncbi:MAG: c-type cytochrome [Planctomyces sp.]|nr:c-type cytochrome [Planctomyces sp.]
MPATDHYRWNQRTLHVVFAASAVGLLAAVLVMMRQDQADEWRPIQRKNFELEAAVRERDLQLLKTKDYEKQLLALEKRKSGAQEEVRKAEAAKPELTLNQDRQQRMVERLQIELKAKNSLRDEARGNYDLAIRDGIQGPKLESLMAEFRTRQQDCNDAQAALDAANAELSRINGELKAITKTLDDVTGEVEKFTSEANRILASLENIRPTAPVSAFKRSIMELPVIDGFNSHLKVYQDWMPGLSQTLGMTKIARFDRCRTCHLNIDKTAAGNLAAFPEGSPSSDEVTKWVEEQKFPQPFATHSRHDLFCSASSPHPVSKFGCTSCHEGQGSGTSFRNAEHTPNDPHIGEDWHKQYGYHPNHFWEYPMQPNRFAESTCIRCHHSVTELGVSPEFGASAPKVFRGYELVKEYGCFGCHEIHGFDGGSAIGPDLRLEPQTQAEADRIAADPGQVAGKMRKVGPSLRHVAEKTTPEWIAYWTEIPSRFRPSTRMPQFFNLSNQEDADAQRFEAAELQGIAQVLIGDSQPLDLLKPAADYVADAERGKLAFTERGCLACHSHSAVEGSKADFGPNISDIHKKVKKNEAGNFSDWLYTWIREPDRHHKRTRMPNLYLDSYTQPDGSVVDPAADIVAFLLSQEGTGDYKSPEVNDADLNDLVTLYLTKARFSQSKAIEIVNSGQFQTPRAKTAGDEAALATDDGAAVTDPAQWRKMKLDYIGRKTISKYGCYACHDMPGYEMARPIGVALQDWGRKDTSKLGFEHIEEFLHHHGEPADSEHKSTYERVESALKDAEAGLVALGQMTPEKAEAELSAAYFYDSILHHGRPGFVWQKLREPRSYDFNKTETKGYDERLRMPKFPLKEDEIEAIATFILGLVAEPPAPDYVYTPNERDQTRLAGEALLAKYNCTGCHMVDLPEVTFGVNLEELSATELTEQDHENARDLLLQFRKPVQALTGEKRKFKVGEEEVELPVAKFKGLRYSFPDPEEDPEFQENGFDSWETLDFGTGDEAKRLLPGSRITVAAPMLVGMKPARGGDFAEFLVNHLKETKTSGNPYLAWQASPPPLIQEGLKVQTPWLHQFLLEPARLRYTTVLRMPRFNMSSEEAKILSNYFAAVDGAEFPYQEQGPTDADYLTSREAEVAHAGLLAEGEDYLEESWRSLNGPLCVKCHSVGGRKFKVSDPAKDIQGPNLNLAQQRLRSDWVKLWLYKPTWITPYTSMPVNFPKNNLTQFPDLFNGDPDAQVIGTRDALLNYGRLLEDVGPTVYAPPAAPTAAPAAGGEAGE